MPAPSADVVVPASEARRLASLVGIGGQSGDAVVGLSAVRRARSLAYVFAAASIAENTWQELCRRQRRGVRVLRIADMGALTSGLGRPDVSVLGIKAGPLAEGIGRRLAEGAGPDAADTPPTT